MLVALPLAGELAEQPSVVGPIWSQADSVLLGLLFKLSFLVLNWWLAEWQRLKQLVIAFSIKLLAINFGLVSLYLVAEYRVSFVIIGYLPFIITITTTYPFITFAANLIAPAFAEFAAFAGDIAFGQRIMATEMETLEAELALRFMEIYSVAPACYFTPSFAAARSAGGAFTTFA